MFETLTERLTKTFSFLRDRKELTDENIEEGLRAIDAFYGYIAHLCGAGYNHVDELPLGPCLHGL